LEQIALSHALAAKKYSLQNKLNSGHQIQLLMRDVDKHILKTVRACGYGVEKTL